MKTSRAALGLTLLALLAASGLATAQSQDPAELRARQLEIFEELLTRTVQEHVQSSVTEGIEAERVGDVDGEHATFLPDVDGHLARACAQRIRDHPPEGAGTHPRRCADPRGTDA